MEELLNEVERAHESYPHSSLTRIPPVMAEAARVRKRALQFLWMQDVFSWKVDSYNDAVESLREAEKILGQKLGETYRKFDPLGKLCRIANFLYGQDDFLIDPSVFVAWHLVHHAILTMLATEEGLFWTRIARVECEYCPESS